jgi:SAM-dependent methyltransferase
MRSIRTRRRSSSRSRSGTGSATSGRGDSRTTSSGPADRWAPLARCSSPDAGPPRRCDTRTANLAVERLAIEHVAQLDRRFDHIVCTGVLHHLADPPVGLRALHRVLAPGGAITLMVYAPYGRAGVYLLQDYCRRLGIVASSADLRELVATLRELPAGHPLGRLLRESPDFADDDALADALLNPRDRPYSVPQLFELIGDVGLRFGRWERQAPYLPDCGSISETPHAARIARLAPVEQYAAMELFRGTITRHTAIVYSGEPGGDPVAEQNPGGADISDWVPVVAPFAIAVEERLPAGAAAALINRAHSDTDLVLFVDRRELRTFRAIDGVRTVGQLGRAAHELMVRLWRHDLVVFDTTGAGAAEGATA